MRDNSREKSSIEGQLIVPLIGEGFDRQFRCCLVAVQLNCANTSIFSSTSTAEPRRVFVNQQCFDGLLHVCHCPHPVSFIRIRVEQCETFIDVQSTRIEFYLAGIYMNDIQIASDMGCIEQGKKRKDSSTTNDHGEYVEEEHRPFHRRRVCVT